MPPEHSDNQQQGPSRADLLRCIIAYADLFDDIDSNDRPEGDVRHRFLGLRAARARYVESRVLERGRAWEELQNELKSSTADLDDGDCLPRFEKAMVELDQALHWYSRVNEEDSKAAKAPVVDQYFMDSVFRYYMEQPGKGLRAPNGELRSLYGSTGHSVSPTLMASRGCDSDFIRDIITQNLMAPFHQRVFVPCQTYYRRILGRNAAQQSQGVSGATLDILVNTVECLIAVGCVAGAVILLYNLSSTKDRLIAATFLSFAFPFPVVFFSQEAMQTFSLTAMIWAVLIVFLTTANLSSKAD